MGEIVGQVEFFGFNLVFDGGTEDCGYSSSNCFGESTFSQTLKVRVILVTR